jgi:hypothetical protein
MLYQGKEEALGKPGGWTSRAAASRDNGASFQARKLYW